MVKSYYTNHIKSLDASYKSYNIQSTKDIEPFNRYIEVYGLKIAGLREIGGNVAVEDEFIRKVAQTTKLLLNPGDKSINSESQIKAIKHLKTVNSLQRIGVEEMNTYTPVLNGDNYLGWDSTNDKHSLTDFIWQFNLSGKSEKTANSQITEVLEHLLHTLVRFALPGAFPEQFLFIEERSPEYGGDVSKEEPILSGLLYEAAKEAISNGVFDPSSYNQMGIGSFPYWKTVMVEYQYALTFAEWGYIEKYSGSLDPEWSDNFLTPEKINEGNPLGHSLYENYIKKVISKPSSNELEEIFEEKNQGLSGYIANTGLSSSDQMTGSSRNETFFASEGDDLINGGEGSDTYVYTGNFSDYSFKRENNSLKVVNKRTIANSGTDTLSNFEYIKFADQIIEESKVDVTKTYSGKFSDYVFYNKSNEIYQIKTDSGYDDITGFPLLIFSGESITSSFKEISAINDIKGTFDQVTGVNTDDAKMFRLYNAAFKRLPDADGLKYWIEKYSSGENDDRSVSQSFLNSDEFKQRYGDNVSNAKYVKTLYVNVLGREYDQDGYNYWLGNLNNGVETRYELLLGFAESTENKLLFTEMTGLS